MLPPNYSNKANVRSQQLDQNDFSEDKVSPDGELQKELRQLEILLSHGVRIPLTQLAICDREVILDRLDRIKRTLPHELTMAIEILSRQQEIVSRAETYARDLVESAEIEADKIIRESSIITRAELEAAKIELNIERECDRAKQETQKEIQLWREDAIAEIQALQDSADDYADGVLGNIERQLLDMLSVIERGRQELESSKGDRIQ